MKKMFRQRAMMSILFVGALYTTITSITNISLADLHILMSDDQQVIAPIDRTTSDDEDRKRPLTLEETIQLEKYPQVTVVATGYTAGIESTGKTRDHPEYGITYSGVEVKRDLYSTIAADLNVYPIGTILFIPDYGYGVVADKGSAITGNKIDLYYETVEDVYAQWGKKELDIYVIKRGDGTLTAEELVALNEDEALQVFREQIISRE